MKDIFVTSPQQMEDTITIEEEFKEAVKLFETNLHEKIKNQTEYFLVIYKKLEEIVRLKIEQKYKQAGWRVAECRNDSYCKQYPRTYLILRP